jgi:glycosyltransferase involved in cell wall biosynthesis
VLYQVQDMSAHPQKKKILINAYNILNQFTGIAVFSAELIAAMERIIKQKGLPIELTFHVPRGRENHFGHGKKYIIANRWRSYFPWKNSNYDIVYGCDQFFKFLKASDFSSTTKKVVTLHDLNFLHQDYTDEQKAKKIHQLKTLVRDLDCVIAISQFVKDDFLKTIDFPESKVKVIYNGASNPLLRQPSVNEMPDYQPQRPFLFSLGGINDKKNWHVVLPVLKKFDGEYILSGYPDVDYIRELQSTAKKLGVNDRLKIIPAINDLHKNWYYKHCEAFLFPSLAEGFGLPVVEAMYCGKPVFISKYGSLPEVGGDSAFVFPDLSPETVENFFAQKMNEALPSLSESLSQRAQQFTWEKCAEKYLDVFLNF